MALTALIPLQLATRGETCGGAPIATMSIVERVLASLLQVFRIIALVAFSLVLLAGCTGMAARPTLDGSAWQLTGWSEPSADPGAFTITASFAEGGKALLVFSPAAPSA